MLGQVSRRQPGCSVLSNQLLQQRRHTGRCRRHRPSRPIYWRAFRGTLALGVLLFVQGKKPAEDGSGFGIGQVDLTQIPESRAHVKALEMVVAGGDLKPDTLQTEGAVGAALNNDAKEPRPVRSGWPGCIPSRSRPVWLGSADPESDQRLLRASATSALRSGSKRPLVCHFETARRAVWFRAGCLSEPNPPLFRLRAWTNHCRSSEPGARLASARLDTNRDRALRPLLPDTIERGSTSGNDHP